MYVCYCNVTCIHNGGIPYKWTKCIVNWKRERERESFEREKNKWKKRENERLLAE